MSFNNFLVLGGFFIQIFACDYFFIKTKTKQTRNTYKGGNNILDSCVNLFPAS